MTTQMTVRIPDDLAEFADAQVSSGAARSRAAVITRALRREQRRAAALADARIYAAMRPGDDDLAGIADLAGITDLSDLD